jgi:hypothetical protein
MHLADGEIAVSRSRLSKGEQGVDETVAFMMKMAKGQYGIRSAKIRALAINIVNAAGVADKDYYGMIKAIHNWVRDEIRYVKDPVGQETLSFPEETAFNSKAGDCLAENTRLLTPTGYVAIKDVKPGMVIQGRKGWTKVAKVWDKGVLPVKDYHLDNGGLFTATDDHRCFRLTGEEVRAADLRVGDALLGPANIELPESRGALTADDCYLIGLFLADGWADGLTVSISGKDGFAKEAQKHWVQTYAEGRGWQTKWNARYIDVWIPKSHPLHAFFYSGRLAPEKAIPDSILAELTPPKLRRLLDGMLADSYNPLTSQRTIGAEKLRKRQTRSGTCYSTTSHDLAKQARLLFRLTGIGVRDTLVVDHGGLGTHPIHRIYPRFYRPKPAKIEEIVEAGAAHCYDIATADHGIYLPDADVVVHNCDDKTILEIALLGSLGIRAWPVVIGVRPGHYSHVYLDVEVPIGGKPGTKAGQILHADPIMREWELGREAPAEKITQKKTYEELAGLSGLSGNTHMSLGAYATAPSYLDEENVSSVSRAMRAPLVDTGSRGEILNAPKVNERNTSELDDMFQTQPTLAMTQAPWSKMGPDGPVTGAEAAGSVSMSKTRTYETAAVGRRSFKPRYRPVSEFQKRLPGQAPDGVMVNEGPKGDETDEILGYVNSIMGDALGGVGDVKKKAVVATVLARRHVNRKKAQLRAVGGGFLPGLGALESSVGTAERILAPSQDADAQDAGIVMAILEDSGTLKKLEDTRLPFAVKVRMATPMSDASAVTPEEDVAGLGGFLSSFGKTVSNLAKNPAKTLARPAVRRNLLNLATGGLYTTGMAMAAAAGVPEAKKQLRQEYGDKWGGRLQKYGAVMDVAVLAAGAVVAAPVIAGGGSVMLGAGASGTIMGGTTVIGGTLVSTTALAAAGATVGAAALVGGGMAIAHRQAAKKAAEKREAAAAAAIASSATPLPNAGVAFPEPYNIPTTIPGYNGYIPQQNYYGQPQYSGGYAGGQPSADQYYGAGMVPQAPYAAPPVDSFGPQDMGPAEQSFDSSGASSFTREVNAYGDQAPASWDDAGGDMPQSPDMVDDSDSSGDDASEGTVLAPRRRARRIARAVPDVQEEEEVDYADVPMDETDGDETMSPEGTTVDRDVAGLGFWAGNRFKKAFEKHIGGGYGAVVVKAPAASVGVIKPAIPSNIWAGPGAVVKKFPAATVTRRQKFGGVNGLGAPIDVNEIAKAKSKTIDTSDPKAVAAADAEAAAAVKAALAGARKTLRANVKRPQPLKGLDGVDSPMNPMLKMALWGVVGYGLYASLLRKN